MTQRIFRRGDAESTKKDNDTECHESYTENR